MGKMREDAASTEDRGGLTCPFLDPHREGQQRMGGEAQPPPLHWARSPRPSPVEFHWPQAQGRKHGGTSRADGRRNVEGLEVANQHDLRLEVERIGRPDRRSDFQPRSEGASQ